MPEIPNVIPGEPVADEWGNAIRDRVISRFASVASRNSLHPTPSAGDPSYLADSGAVEVYHSGAWRGFVPAGVVMPYAGITPPTGFLICNGALVSRATYAALFAAIGTTYGAGDGTTTFGLPDLRQRFVLGMAAAGLGSTLGEVGGSIDHTHTGPSHTHTGPSHTHTGPSHIHTMGTHTHTGPSHTHSGGTLGTDTEAAHSHTFSDTSGGPSSLSSEWNNGSVFSGASTSHTHSVSGTTSSGGSHAHLVTSGATGAGGTGATGATDPGDTAASGTAATGASGTAATGASGTAVSGVGNPPFMAMHYIIRT